MFTISLCHVPFPPGTRGCLDFQGAVADRSMLSFPTRCAAGNKSYNYASYPWPMRLVFT